MKSGIATMTSKGQLTVPANIREALRLEAGDKVAFHLLEDGTVMVFAINRPIQELFGSVPYDGPPKTIQDIEDGIAEGAAYGEKPSSSALGSAA